MVHPWVVRSHAYQPTHVCIHGPVLQELKKQLTQQIREASTSQSEVVRRLQEAAEKREAALKASQEDCSRLTKRLDLAQSCMDALQVTRLLARMRACRPSSSAQLREGTPHSSTASLS